MLEVAYSREAMRGLLMLGGEDRGRAIEAVERLASAYSELYADAAEQLAAKALKAEAEEASKAEVPEPAEPVSEPEPSADPGESAAADDGDGTEPDKNGPTEDQVAATGAATELKADAVAIDAAAAASDARGEMGPLAVPAPVKIKVPGTLALGASGNFCLAPFSNTGDLVVALADNITVVSVIDVLDKLNEAGSE